MSCCGESKTAPPPQNRPPAFNPQIGPITQQPGATPYISTPYSPPPPQQQNFAGPTPPPPVHQPNGYNATSPQPNNMWGEPRRPDSMNMSQWSQQGQQGHQSPAFQPQPQQQQNLAPPITSNGYYPYGQGGTGPGAFPPTPPASTYNPSASPQLQNKGFAPSPTPLLDPSIPRPTPVYPPRPSTGSPGYTIPADSITTTSQSGPFNPMPEDGRLSVSVDLGTTFSGVAYGSSRIANGRVQQIINWPGSYEQFRKIPTCLLYDDAGNVISWGIEAKNAPAMDGTIRCEWFKLFLEPKALRDDSTVDPRLPRLPPGKGALDVIVDFLTHLYAYAKEQIQREIGAVADLESADVWLTVPAAWDAAGCALMREAAIQARLVRATKADDHFKERLRIITEPEAAAVHCVALTDLHHLRPSQNFMICDAGGGTVDLAVYKIIGQLSHLEIAEICARSGANCGSLFLDLRFRELVKQLLVAHPAHLDQASLAYFMHHFSETEKLGYMGDEDDDKMFQFTCFNVEDPDDPQFGLINGELHIPGNLLRREVFDPVVQEVLNLIEEQTQKIPNQRIDALLMVGGFSASEYLFKRVEAQFGSRMRVVRPSDADTATCRGAAQYGLARRPLVQSVIAPKAYLMKVKLPAEPEDWMKRPAYIRKNDAGIDICENRLQYLVQKGAILRKGQRIKTKFCKYSATLQDRTFVAVLYTADSERVMRYTDEGETDELCKWSVDLATLPSFQQAAQQMNGRGFYTEFELGLELDSVEVRGVLLFNGEEWGNTVFDFLQ